MVERVKLLHPSRSGLPTGCRAHPRSKNGYTVQYAANRGMLYGRALDEIVLTMGDFRSQTAHVKAVFRLFRSVIIGGYAVRSAEKMVSVGEVHFQ